MSPATTCTSATSRGTRSTGCVGRSGSGDVRFGDLLAAAAQRTRRTRKDLSFLWSGSRRQILPDLAGTAQSRALRDLCHLCVFAASRIVLLALRMLKVVGIRVRT